MSKNLVNLEETVNVLHITPSNAEGKSATLIERYQAEVNNYGDNHYDIIRKEKIKKEKKAPSMISMKTRGPLKLRMSSTGAIFEIRMSFAAHEAEEMKDELNVWGDLIIDDAIEIRNRM